MRYITAFLKFWYDFIVGDDWTIATSITVAISLTFWLARLNIQAWWLLPCLFLENVRTRLLWKSG